MNENLGGVEPVIVIAGPTASGKSAVAMALAERHDGEIICADSRTVYKGMDIGTAKPTKDDQRRVPHHLLDIVTPNERFTAADFQVAARASIAEIFGREHVPFVVGGTGLYIDSLILDYQFAHDVNMATRDKYAMLSTQKIRELLEKQRIALPVNHQNRRHLVRALEQGGYNKSARDRPFQNVIVVAIATKKDELELRIRQRTDEIFENDIIGEAQSLSNKYGWDNESMTGNIYPIIRRYLEGGLTRHEAKELFVMKDRQLAKRQITWLKRHNFIKWLPRDEAFQYLDALLSKHL